MPATKPYKAIIAFVLAFLGALATSLQGQKDRLGNMTAAEWLFVVVAALVVAGGTYLVPNPPTGERRRVVR
jgi:preprotein translocase subunit SecY